MRADAASTAIGLDEMSPALQDLFAARVKRLGYLGAFFQHAAHQPEALEHFVRWTDALKKAVPFRLVEVIALTVASRTDNAYELVQHEALALKEGFTEQEIVSITDRRAASCPGLSGEEVAAAGLASCLIDTYGRGCEAALLRLSRLVGEEVAVGCLMTASRYLAHAAMSNAWRLPPPIPSPLGKNSHG